MLQIKSLWGGVGQIYRTRYLGKAVVIKSFVLKENEDSDSYRRKKQSMINEAAFYSYADKQLLPVVVPERVDFIQGKTHFDLTLTCLSEKGFYRLNERSTYDDFALLTRALDELAAFHSHFIHEKVKGAWYFGGYYHLATREYEWQNMPQGPLRDHANMISGRLSNCAITTTIHGDAKRSNIMLSRAGLAWVDFQYAGKGVGVSDLVTLLVSFLTNQHSHAKWQAAIDHYFDALKTHLTLRFDAEKVESVIALWQDLVPFAFADYERFLQGWRFDSKKRTEFVKAMTNKALGLCELDCQSPLQL